MGRRQPKKGQSKGRFARLPVSVLNTPAVTTLRHAEFRVLALLAAQYDGYNNGALGLTFAQARENGISSKNTLYGALSVLLRHKLIEQTFPASRVPPRPTMYALAWCPIDDTEWSRKTSVPSHDYRRFKG